MFKYLWIIILVIIDIAIGIYIFKELPYAIKHQELDEFFEGDAGTYLMFHIGTVIVSSFLYFCIQ